jgi:hypothetical protein
MPTEVLKKAHCDILDDEAALINGVLLGLLLVKRIFNAFLPK